MKHYLITLLALGALFTSCIEDKCTDTVTFYEYEARTISESEWRISEFTQDEGRELCEPSGFYIYGDLLFAADAGKGLHIIDNSNPESPRPISFLNVPGAKQLAVRNGILYLGQYTDILTFDLSNPRKPEFLARTEDVFEFYSVFRGQIDETTAVVEWVANGNTQEYDCTDNPALNNVIWGCGRGNGFCVFIDVAFAGQNSDFSVDRSGGGQPEIVGQGGSLAQITFTNGVLYTIENQGVKAFDLEDPARPELAGTVDLRWGVETIYPYGNLLFIGANNGMHILDASDPLAPTHLSTFEHILSCDPVVVNDDIAYVTLWGGTECGNAQDQVEVIDVSDPTQPRSLQVLPMDASHGLGIADEMLFLACAEDGMRVFQLNANGLIGRQLNHERSFPAWDIIARGDRNELIVFGQGTAGIRQYAYDTNGNLLGLSEFDLCK